MVATASQILHQQDFKADKQVEVVVQSNNIVHLNIDGICAIRIQMKTGCEFRAGVDPLEEEVLYTVSN